ncbi:MAG: NAD(P)-dependent alcohol dehydrogenase [Coxiellaceae bacterium]|nr:NAD(P)-dependent alcohol dehydrogenase [Coxiellaceae bacterium]
MRAYRFTQWHTHATLCQQPIPEPGVGEVRIRMGGAGACLSDVHIMDDYNQIIAPWTPPFTLGHENAGWIDKINGDCPFKTGTAVVIAPAWGCGHCRRCLRGRDNYCLHAKDHLSGGLGLDGGMADYMIAPIRQLVELNTLTPTDAAPLTDAGLSAYHAINRCRHTLTADSTVVIIGAGGLGHMAIQIAVATTNAQIIVVDNKPEALEFAQQLGAHHTLASNKQTRKQIKKLTDGADAVIDFVGHHDTLQMATRAIAPNGQIVLVGFGDGQLTIDRNTLPPGANLSRTLGGTKTELADLVTLAETGTVKAHIETYPLDDVAQVYQALREGKINGRAVLVA